MPLDDSMLFVAMFIALLGWAGIASAVAVSVEQGLKRYKGEMSPLIQPDSTDE